MLGEIETRYRINLARVAALVDVYRERAGEGADLLPYRGMSIQDLIRASVEAHIERTSFNNLGEVKHALRRIGLDTGLVAAHETELASLMARRHQIVHRADRHDERGYRHDAAVSLRHETVQRWFSAVEDLCAAIVAGLGEVRHDL
jgi:hypothetical protein